MSVLQGIDQLEQKLREIELSVRRKMLTDSLRKNAEITRDQAAETFPLVRTGKSKERQIIVRRTAQSTAQVAVVQVGPARDVFYDLFDEIGTAFQTAKPYLGPAFESTKDEVLQKTGEDFKAAVENYRG